MNRPITLLCLAGAIVSGLYLYQSKHAAQMLDRDIAKTIDATEQARKWTVLLRTDWARLNEPERLADLARLHTSLQALKPAQFATLTDLASRLPAPLAPGQDRPAIDPAEPEDAAPLAPSPTAAKPAAPEPKPDPKPAMAEAKPAVRHVTVAATAMAPARPAPPSRPDPVLAERPHPAPPAMAPVIANNDATAPGTVGAAVLRAMRARETMATAPAPAYAPQPVYAPQPAYAPQSAYAAPAPSLLGGRSALPPPVPFAAR